MFWRSRDIAGTLIRHFYPIGQMSRRNSGRWEIEGWMRDRQRKDLVTCVRRKIKDSSKIIRQKSEISPCFLPMRHGRLIWVDPVAETKDVSRKGDRNGYIQEWA